MLINDSYMYSKTKSLLCTTVFYFKGTNLLKRGGGYLKVRLFCEAFTEEPRES